MARAPMDEFFRALGFNVQDLVAGFCGGLVNVFVRKRTKPFDAVGAVVVGMLSANYLGETAVKYLGTGQLATGFLVGLCGMSICLAVMEVIRNWRPISVNAGADQGGRDA